MSVSLSISCNLGKNVISGLRSVWQLLKVISCLCMSGCKTLLIRNRLCKNVLHAVVAGKDASEYASVFLFDTVSGLEVAIVFYI